MEKNINEFFEHEQDFQAPDFKASYSVNVVSAKGEKSTITLAGEQAKTFIIADKTVKQAKGLDLNICRLFAQIDRFNPSTGKQEYKLGASTRDIIMQEWRYSKATANTYLNIGKTFFKSDASEKVKGITAFSVGQILPFVAIAKDFPVVAGVDTDYDFMEWLIANGRLSASMSVEELTGIANVWKSCYLPEEWFTEVDGEWILTSADGKNEYKTPFTACPYLRKQDKPDNAPDDNATEDKSEDKPEDKPENTIQTSLFASILKVLSAVDDMPVSDELRSEWANVKEQVLIVAKKIDEYKPEQEQEREQEQGKSKSKK